ncbi:MAG: transcription antitermination factor NusB [Deltaproteobacteria bacterium]|nr:transcription antitermination factor NusB [Deltaproteobacteria bacterium]MBW2048212.1 transcription antitermination factor NusB [Deltaproteobacteria bacterium]MBW2111444.1 transcription antitermination factor NusB [Deltaproteobacteria bacterium]MBW2352155.1 transcription antitermination factor NusB [Deltaproteobacteria bacterium]HDZ89632.1 transcription antitermination factor NusB [Deltaproteobacteria bacterium]
MGERRRARELAVQVLFHLEFSPDDPSEVFDLICENFQAGKSIRGFSKRLVLGVCHRKKTLDELISEASENWRIERMSRLDRSILRLATYEIVFLDDIPPKVSLDEAVEIGKRFGSEDSGRYINGVLDRIYNTKVRGD